MIYEHALDLVDVTTKALKAASAVRSAKGSTAIPHVEDLVRSSRACWIDACEQEGKAWDEAHSAGPPAEELAQETLAFDEVPGGAEDGGIPPLEAGGQRFFETEAHANLPAGDPFGEIAPPELDDAGAGVQE